MKLDSALIMQLSNVLIICFGVGYFLYDRYIKRFIRVNILRKTGDLWFLVNSKRFSMSVEKVEFDKHTYIVDLDKAIIDKRNRPILYYKVGVFHPIPFTLEGLDTKINTINLTQILKSNRIGKLLHSVMDKTYLLIIIILIISIVAIGFVSMFLINQQNTQLVQLLKQVNNATIISRGY